MVLIEKAAEAATARFGLLVVATGVLALLHPPLFLPLLPHIKLLLGVIMFGMGTTLNVADFSRILRRPFLIITGVSLQFLIMPLAGVAVAWLLRLPPELASGVVLLGCCPGGTASNVIVYLARGDVALSVSLTAFSTAVAPLLTPTLTWLLAGQWMEVSAGAMFLDIVQVVALPVALGLLLNRLKPEAVAQLQGVLPLISITAILAIIGAVVAANSGNIGKAAIPVIAAVILHNAFGLLLGYIAAIALRVNMQARRAITVEVGMQNSGLAAALATAHMSPLSALPGAIFSVWHNISGALLVSFWTRKQADESSGEGAMNGTP